MDAPRIQYAKTEDGVSIAYCTVGSGPPLVWLPQLWVSHLQMDWEEGPLRTTVEALAERSLVVRFDHRGMGMSDRDALDFSVQSGVLDLGAVVDRMGLDRVSLLAGSGDSACLAFASQRPGRVSHLVYNATRLRRHEPEIGRHLAAADPLMEGDWELYTEIFARLVVGWDSPIAASRAEQMRATHTPASFRLAFHAMDEPPFDYLASIKVPTLILQNTLQGGISADFARRIAGGIEGAHVMAYTLPRGLGMAPLVPSILDFVNSEPVTPGGRVEAPRIDLGAFRTILFTDIEAHTAMMQRLGDAKGREVLREHERITREALRAHGGTEVKTIGDSFMASFPSAQKAVECAIALQRAFQQPIFASGSPSPPTERGSGGEVFSSASPSPSTEPVLSLVEGRGPGGEVLRVRVGINAGEPIADEDDLFGSSVILASRTKEKAAGGEIFVTDVVRQLVAGKGFSFTDRGEMDMKGFEEPVRLYEVRWS